MSAPSADQQRQRPDVSLVIPCYNEEETLPHLVEALDSLRETMHGRAQTIEVVVIDDGSKDESFSLLCEAAAERLWLVAVQLKRNYGQTAAMSAGFDLARGKVIIPMDADLQNDPADVPALLDKLDEGYDVVSGWRRKRKDTFVTRKLPSKIANWIIGRVSGLPLHDYGCTMKAYKAEYLKGVRLYGEMHRFIPIYAKWEGARVTEMVVNHHARRFGRSKYGLGRTIKVLLDLITVKFLGDYSTKPLYMFGKPGLLSCFIGIAFAAWALADKLLAGIWVHRNPLALLAVLFFIVGVQLIGMGLLAELQVRTYHESQDKRIYKIRYQVNACVESPESSSQRAAPLSSASRG
jgi:glycosyltransferase involved in cell wall biosynthesis